MKKISIFLKSILLAAVLGFAGLSSIEAQAETLNTGAVAAAEYAAVFDAGYYLAAYPDLQQTIGSNPQALFEHFVTIGMAEGRRACAGFDVKAYKKYNPDLESVFGADLPMYYRHYLSVGKNESRRCTEEGSDAFSAAARGNILSIYTTFYAENEDRAINVHLAADKINGMILQPGSIFSYSNAVGERTEENGYVMAPSFAAGRVVSSVGGGICQVSSTLYAGMKTSGIQAIERYPHSLQVEYVPEGYDAAIAAGYKDFRFVNENAFPIKISADAVNGILTVSLVQA